MRNIRDDGFQPHAVHRIYHRHSSPLRKAIAQPPPFPPPASVYFSFRLLLPSLWSTYCVRGFSYGRYIITLYTVTHESYGISLSLSRRLRCCNAGRASPICFYRINIGRSSTADDCIVKTPVTRFHETCDDDDIVSVSADHRDCIQEQRSGIASLEIRIKRFRLKTLV